MNILTLTLLEAAAAFTVTPIAFAQGTVFLNNFGSDHAIYYLTSETPAPIGTYVVVLAGASPTSLAPLGSGPIKIDFVDGYFDQGYAAVPGVPAFGTGWFAIRAWVGASSYAAATERIETTVWSQPVGNAPLPSDPPLPAPLQVPANIVIVKTSALGLDIGLRMFDGTATNRIACEASGPIGYLESPLRIAKNGTSYGIVLVETNSPYASKIQVKTPAAVIKAWAKLP